MIKLKYGYSVINIPGIAMQKIKDAGELDLRVLLSVSGGIADENEIADFLGADVSNVLSSVSFWRGAGIFEADEPKNKLTPSDSASRVYTGNEIAEIRKTDSSIDSLISGCQKILRANVFTHAESSSVVYLRQNLGFEPEYVLLLCSYYSQKEKISMRFIEKRAIDLYDKGIKTIGALEEYLGEEDKRYDTENIVRKLFGLGERAFTAKEKAYIKDWTTKWHVSEEMIRRAFEETVSKTQTPTLAYCNAILKSWHEAGIDSSEGVENEKQSYKKKKSSAKEKDSGFDLDEFFDLALKRGEGAKGE